MKDQQAQAQKKTISLPKRVLEGALARGQQQNRTLSNYIQSLILKDLNGELETPRADTAEQETKAA